MCVRELEREKERWEERVRKRGGKEKDRARGKTERKNISVIHRKLAASLIAG